MPSSEVRYQRGDHYRHHDDDLLQHKMHHRSSSGSTSSLLSGPHRKKPSRTKSRLQPSVAGSSSVSSKASKVQCYKGQQEDYLTKKKVEVKTTKNTEKRVQRCIVLEDGRIIEHDDPHIIVDTVEDTQTHEFDHLDDKELSTQLQASIERSYRRAGIDVNEVDLAGGKQKRPQSRPRKSLAYHDGHPSHLISSTSAADVVKAHNFDDDNHDIVGDTFKRVVNTHDVRENIVRTHAAKDLGVISKRGLRKVLKKQGKVSDYIKYDNDNAEDYPRRDSKKKRNDNSAALRKYEKESHRRIVDTQDTHQISRRMKDGQIRTETVRNEMHEIFDNKAAPDSDRQAISGSSETEHEKDTQEFRLQKTQEFTDYFDGRGNLLSQGPHITSKDTQVVRPQNVSMDKWADILGEERVQQHRNSMKKKLRPTEDAERTDALTKRPLDLNREERTRKKETNKWLERHFGSDWSLAGGGKSSSASAAGNFKYMDTNEYLSSMFDPHKVRRTMSFSSIPIKYTNPGEKVSRVIKQTTTTIRPGFDKHVVSSVTKAMLPQQCHEDEDQVAEQHRSSRGLEASRSRPYHSTLTLATDSRQALFESQRHAASSTSLAAAAAYPQETSHMTLRKVPITRVLPSDSSKLQGGNLRPKKNQRVQHLKDHGDLDRRSSGGSRARSTTHRRSYFYGEEPIRVQSEPPKAKAQTSLRQSSADQMTPVKRTVPLYRTELLKTSDKMYVDQVINDHADQHELSKSYHDISTKKPGTSTGIGSSHRELSKSYRDLPSNSKPSRLFGWTDEFSLHGYGGLRAAERNGVERSKSFACQGGLSDQASGSLASEEESYNFMSHHHHTSSRSRKTQSYKNTKVSNFMEDTIEPPQEFAGLDTRIQKKYNVAKNCLQQNQIRSTENDNNNAIYEFERKIPMQSSILEAQKFKTVIFVSGN